MGQLDDILIIENLLNCTLLQLKDQLYVLIGK